MGALKGGRPKISLFFVPSPTLIFVLFLSRGGLLVEFWWCLKRRDPLMCTFGDLRLSCETLAAPSCALSRGST